MIKLRQISNTSFKNVRKLLQKKYRQSTKSFIVEGKKILEEAFKSNSEVNAILVTKNFLSKKENENIAKIIDNSEIVCYEISQKQLESITDTETAQGIAGIIKTNDSDIRIHDILNQQESTVVILDQITDPGNLGTIIRTCDWFGVDLIALGNNSTELYNPKVIRSTMGSIFHIPILDSIELEKFINNLKNNNYKIVTTVLDGQPLYSLPSSSKIGLVFGNEAHGISKSLCDLSDIRLTIPKYGEIESLNVSVACGIVLANRFLK
jgi:RNA methyltransferase, TrmH family